MLYKNISYRQLDENDGSSVKDIFYHAIYYPPGKPQPPKSIIETPVLLKYYIDWGKETDLGYAACVQHKMVGAAWVRLLTGENKGYGYVDETTPELTIAVLPGYRNNGIGNSLLSLLFDQVKKHYRQISLSVSKGNPAYRLYTRAGFIPIAENEQDRVMVIKLPR